MKKNLILLRKNNKYITRIQIKKGFLYENISRILLSKYFF